LVKRGKTSRLKRKPAPKFWPIHKKEKLWVVKPSSGPHSLKNCLSLTLVLRDLLGMTETRKESKTLLNHGKVLVNGKVVAHDDFPVGLMDVIAMPDASQYFRILPSHKGLTLCPISKEEANFKFARIDNKATVSNGIQLNLHDGTNLLIKTSESQNPKEDIYETYNILKLSLPNKDITGCIQLKEGNYVVITGGKNIGVKGKIVEIEKTVAKKRKNALVIVEDDKGTRCQTILNFVFTINEVNQPAAPQMETA